MRSSCSFMTITILQFSTLFFFNDVGFLSLHIFDTFNILDPGCGRSLTRVCVPAEWSWPLLRLASKRGVTWKIYRGMQFAAKNQWSLLERRGYTFAHSVIQYTWIFSSAQKVSKYVVKQQFKSQLNRQPWCMVWNLSKLKQLVVVIALTCLDLSKLHK